MCNIFYGFHQLYPISTISHQKKRELVIFLRTILFSIVFILLVYRDYLRDLKMERCDMKTPLFVTFTPFIHMWRNQSQDSRYLWICIITVPTSVLIISCPISGKVNGFWPFHLFRILHPTSLQIKLLNRLLTCLLSGWPSDLISNSYCLRIWWVQWRIQMESKPSLILNLVLRSVSDLWRLRGIDCIGLRRLSL